MTINPVTDPALIVLVGIAGSGKSTLAAARWQPAQVLSLDALREAVSDDESDQAATRDAVAVLHALAAARLSRRLTTVIDATNVEAGVRLGLVKLAASRGMPAVAVVVDTPLTLCHARNAARSGPRTGARWGRRVPADVIDAQHRQLRAALPQLQDEGFAEVLIHEPEVGDPAEGETYAAGSLVLVRNYDDAEPGDPDYEGPADVMPNRGSDGELYVDGRPV